MHYTNMINEWRVTVTATLATLATVASLQQQQPASNAIAHNWHDVWRSHVI